MFFKVLLIGFAIFLILLFPILGCFLFHPISDIKYFVLDTFNYFRHKMYNVCKGTGKLRIYIGLFGRGKTLSCVHDVVSLYKKYDNKMVWSNDLNKFVPQRVVVLSNVSLSIPYIELESIGHFVNFVRERYEYDRENGCVTVTLCLIDELSTQLNSRSFKTNIDPLFLNTLLTCRKFRCGLYGTAQRFNQVDALLRQVTQEVIDCNKIWRFQCLKVFDGWLYENATDSTKVKSKRKLCWFVHNKDFANYDTLALVDNLKKSVESGDMISESEILELMNPSDNITVVSDSRKKRKKKVS